MFAFSVAHWWSCASLDYGYERFCLSFADLFVGLLALMAFWGRDLWSWWMAGSLSFLGIPYIYIMCVSCVEGKVYEEFTEEDGLWHRVKLVFLPKRPSKKGYKWFSVVHITQFNTKREWLIVKWCKFTTGKCWFLYWKCMKSVFLT